MRHRLLPIPLVFLALAGCPGSTDEAASTPESAATEAPPSEAPGEAAGSAEAEPAPEAEAQPEPEPEPEPVDPDAAIRASVHGGGPLSEEALAVFRGSAEDDAPEVLLATRPDLEGRHYLYCDELNLDVWYEQVRDIGGGYAGVGSDQAYTFIGWMKPDLAWFTDYDPWIGALHQIYGAFFEASEDIETFRGYWDDDNREQGRALLRERFAEADEGDRERILLVYEEARYKVARRLRRIRSMVEGTDIPTFVSDEATYQWVRNFVMQGRGRPMLANLIDDEALRAVGDVGRRLEVPIRVFYLSNAEDYWAYPDEFRENFAALHFDERSLILRTNAAKRTNGDYRYNSQSALNFQQWLAQPYVRSIDDIWEHEYIRDEDHIPVSHIDEPPVDR